MPYLTAHLLCPLGRLEDELNEPQQKLHRLVSLLFLEFLSAQKTMHQHEHFPTQILGYCKSIRQGFLCIGLLQYLKMLCIFTITVLNSAMGVDWGRYARKEVPV